MSLLDSLLDKFAAADAIWLASVRPDGRPHLAPIWHIWHSNAAWVVTQGQTVRAQNLALNRAVSLSLPDPMNALILEGWATEAPDAVGDIEPVFLKKYKWDIGTDPGYNHILRITPTKLMAWGDHGQGRWRFDAASSSWEWLQ